MFNCLFLVLFPPFYAGATAPWWPVAALQCSIPSRVVSSACCLGSLSWLLCMGLWLTVTHSLPSFLPSSSLSTSFPVSICPCSTASNSNRSTPACSPILRKRSRSPTPQNQDGDTMVEKGSDHSSDKSPSTPEQGVQRSCSSQSGRSGGKNSKVSRPCRRPGYPSLLSQRKLLGTHVTERPHDCVMRSCQIRGSRGDSC